MSLSRIIQDSDGEEDNFSDIVSSADPLHDQESARRYLSDFGANNVQLESNDTELCQLQTLGSDVPHVNLDDKFLVSPLIGGDPSSSHRRNEQRWIPSDDVGVSIGVVVSEINGIRRAREDDNSHVDQQFCSIDGPDESAHFSSPSANKLKRSRTMGEMDDRKQGQKRRRAVTTYLSSSLLMAPHETASRDGQVYEGLNMVEPSETELYEQRDQLGCQAAVLGDNLGTSVTTTYNFFESSAIGGPGLVKEQVTPLTSDRTEDWKEYTPQRSKSLQAGWDSPHDTEPFSLVSSQWKRLKSDLGSRGLSQESLGTVQKEQPADLGLLGVKKNRGSPKKPTIDETTEEQVEVDGLAEETIDQQQRQSKRQPRKPELGDIANIEDSEFPTEDARGDLAISLKLSPARQGRVGDSEEMINGTHQSKCGEIGLRSNSDDKPRPGRSHTSASEKIDKPGKEPKKKKLKRGKTTSIIVKKSYESDVEGDVLWVEDRPASEIINVQGTESILIKQESCANGGSHETKDVSKAGSEDKPKQGPISLEILLPAEPSALEPKRRGRKRKKTADAENIEAQAEEQRCENASEQNLGNKSNMPRDISNTSIANHSPEADNKDTRLVKNPNGSTDALLETPKKQNLGILEDPDATVGPRKGPDKHSPIPKTSKAPFRVGLSRKARIAPLLKVVRK
ncbi:hypothetical protein V8E54_001346 [Elaphomyces granulatus]